MSVLLFPFSARPRAQSPPAGSRQPFIPSVSRRQSIETLSKADQALLDWIDSKENLGYPGVALRALLIGGNKNRWAMPLTALGALVPLPLFLILDVLRLPFCYNDPDNSLTGGNMITPFDISRTLPQEIIPAAFSGRALTTVQIESCFMEHTIFPSDFDACHYMGQELYNALTALKSRKLVVEIKRKKKSSRWYLTPEGRRIAKIWHTAHLPPQRADTSS